MESWWDHKAQLEPPEQESTVLLICNNFSLGNSGPTEAASVSSNSSVPQLSHLTQAHIPSLTDSAASQHYWAKDQASNTEAEAYTQTRSELQQEILNSCSYLKHKIVTGFIYAVVFQKTRTNDSELHFGILKPIEIPIMLPPNFLTHPSLFHSLPQINIFSSHRWGRISDSCPSMPSLSYLPQCL